MYRELIICVITVIGIILLNNLSGNYTKESVSELTGELMSLRTEMSDNNMKDENIYNKGNDIYEKWRQRHKVLAYYLEHDELEKVEKNLTALKSAIDAEEYANALSELDESAFVLRHIEEKNKFDLKNIF